MHEHRNSENARTRTPRPLIGLGQRAVFSALIACVSCATLRAVAPESVQDGRIAEGAFRVRVATLESGTVEGFPQQVDAGGRIHINADGEDKSFSLDSVSSIEILQTKSALPVESLNGAVVSKSVCYLRDGGRISGRLLSGGARSLQLDVGFAPPVTVPFDALAAVRFASFVDAPSEAELTARLATRDATRDLLIVPKGSTPVVLSGALEGLGPDGWEFRLPTRMQKAPLDRAYAVVLGAAPAALIERHARVTLTGGDRFSADILTAGNASLKLKTDFGEVGVHWTSIARIDIRSDRVTWLGDAKFKSQSVKSALGVDWTPRSNLNVTGGPIRLGGRTFQRGLGVHGTTTLAYELDGKQSRLQAVIGLDDMVGRRGSVIFRVIGDGRELFKSDVLRGGAKPVDISVDITGVKVLELSTDAADGLDLGDHANWADVRMIRAAPGGVS